MNSGELYNFDAALHAAYASYDDHHTLWMHDQGRITLHSSEVSNLKAEAERKEQHASQNNPSAVLAGLAITESSLTRSTTTGEDNPNFITFMRAEQLIDAKFRETASADPRRNVQPWQAKDTAEFAVRGITHAVDLCDGSSGDAWDTHIRKLQTPDSLSPAIQITKLENINGPDGPVPVQGGNRLMRVRYTINPEGTVADGQHIDVNVRMENRWRPSKTTVKDRSGFSGNYPVTDAWMDVLLNDTQKLAPRAGRVWPVFS